MTTLSPTRARANLTSLLKRAANGEDIGILHGDQVIALRPVTLHSDDYALQEYGVTEKELDRFVRRMNKRLARDRRAGKMKVSPGILRRISQIKVSRRLMKTKRRKRGKPKGMSETDYL